jgi:Rrf2 family transcriptional regulator, nitric oxide-sensitive transcriptional repressor
MRLTVYTDYTLRVLIYLTLKYKSGEKSTIPEMAEAYGISRNHLMKIVHELSLRGIIETSQGRSGGTWLARPPNTISVGEIVRFSEPDFAIVECHVKGQEVNCAVWEACNLKRGFHRALDAFMQELDKMTMADAVTKPSVAASLLHLDSRGQRVIRIAAAASPKPAKPANASAGSRERRKAPAAAARVATRSRRAIV